MRAGILVIALAITLTPAVPAVANMITLEISAPKPRQATGGSVILELGHTDNVFLNGMFVEAIVRDREVARVRVTKDDTATTKRDKIFDDFTKGGLEIAKDGDNKIKITKLPKKGAILFHDLASGEKTHTLNAVDDPTAAMIEFAGDFAEFDEDGLRTEFTAGVSTDRGSANVTLDSNMFADLSGATIAETLFLRLMPFASSLGIILFQLHPEEIDINFLDGVAVAGAGIVFGSSSPDGMVSGAINVGAVPAPDTLALVLAAGLAALIAVRRRNCTRRVSRAGAGWGRVDDPA